MIERRALTEVLVIGMLTRWISVSISPNGERREAGRSLAVGRPMMTNKNIMVSTTSAVSAAPSPYLPGEWSP